MSKKDEYQEYVEEFMDDDKPIYKVDMKYLQDHRLWCHAKNLEIYALLDTLV